MWACQEEPLLKTMKRITGVLWHNIIMQYVIVHYSMVWAFVNPQKGGYFFNVYRPSQLPKISGHPTKLPQYVAPSPTPTMGHREPPYQTILYGKLW